MSGWSPGDFSGGSPVVMSAMDKAYALYDYAIRKPSSVSVYMCPHVVGFIFTFSFICLFVAAIRDGDIWLAVPPLPLPPSDSIAGSHNTLLCLSNAKMTHLIKDPYTLHSALPCVWSCSCTGRGLQNLSVTGSDKVIRLFMLIIGNGQGCPFVGQ